MRLAGEAEIEERSFVAKGAPLDDGQKRLDGRTRRLGEADGLNPHPLLEAEAQRVRHPERQKLPPFAECAKDGPPGNSTAYELRYLPWIATSSMSKIRVELGPMAPPAPREP